MKTIDSIALHVADPASAEAFYARAFNLGDRLRFMPSDAPSSGFRGYTLSLITSQPADARALIDAAAEHGAEILKPAAKSLWGFGGSLRAPDGAVWNIATSSKKDTQPASTSFDEIVLLLGVKDIKASKSFYTERGLRVGKSFGGYVEFETEANAIGFGLNKRTALAKSVGVDPDGSGSHGITISGSLGDASDPDGFVWART